MDQDVAVVHEVGGKLIMWPNLFWLIILGVNLRIV